MDIIERININGANLNKFIDRLLELVPKNKLIAFNKINGIIKYIV